MKLLFYRKPGTGSRNKFVMRELFINAVCHTDTVYVQRIFFNEGDSRCTGYLSYCVVPRSTDRCKALLTSNDYIVIAAGAVND